MTSLRCNVDVVYQLKIWFRTEENHEKLDPIGRYQTLPAACYILDKVPAFKYKKPNDSLYYIKISQQPTVLSFLY
jgi:hypothetical protein